MDQEPNAPEGSNKIKRRLARKAELARASRRRKKAYVQDLEMKVAQLNAKVMELQSQDPLSSDPRAVALALSAMTELDKPSAKSEEQLGLASSTVTTSVMGGEKRDSTMVKYTQEQGQKKLGQQTRQQLKGGGRNNGVRRNSAVHGKGGTADILRATELSENHIDENSSFRSSPQDSLMVKKTSSNHLRAGATNHHHLLAASPTKSLLPSYCIKANFEGDIRRFSLPATSFSFDALNDMLSTIYRLEAESFFVTYFDDDDDAVTITSTAELIEAYRLVRPVSNQSSITDSAADDDGLSPGLLQPPPALPKSVLKVFVNSLHSPTKQHHHHHQQQQTDEILRRRSSSSIVGTFDPQLQQYNRIPSNSNSSRIRKKYELDLKEREFSAQNASGYKGSSRGLLNGNEEDEEGMGNHSPNRNEKAYINILHILVRADLLPPPQPQSQMKEVKLGLPCTVSRLWLPVNPNDTLGRSSLSLFSLITLYSNIDAMNNSHEARKGNNGASNLLSAASSSASIQRLSCRARLLDLKSTVRETGSACCCVVLIVIIDGLMTNQLFMLCRWRVLKWCLVGVGTVFEYMLIVRRTAYILSLETDLSLSLYLYLSIYKSIPQSNIEQLKKIINTPLLSPLPSSPSSFWIEATVSPMVRVHVLLQSVMAHVGFLSLKGSSSQRPVWLLYKGVRIPKHQEETLEAYSMKDGDRVDVVDKVAYKLKSSYHRWEMEAPLA
eukprot:jgi/Bigna1/83353/fgenesh1_pg.106_\